MGWVDIAILALIVVSTVIGVVRGLVREVLSLVAWVAAFWVALAFADALAPHLGFVSDSEAIRSLTAFAGLFVVTLIVGALVNYMIGILVKSTGLGGTDRVLGMVFGLLRGVVVVGALLVVGLVGGARDEDWWQESVMVGGLEPVALWLHGFLPDDIGS